MRHRLPVSAALVATLAGVLAGCAESVADRPDLGRPGHPEASLNTRLIGVHDLQARSAYQPLPVAQGNRRILYVGHHAGKALNSLSAAIEVNGTSILDITDAANPVYLHHIPPTGNADQAQMVQVCSGAELPQADPTKVYLLRSNGNESHEIWEVTDPARPVFLTELARMGHTPDGEMHTHKNWWECETGIVYLVGTRDGWRAPRILQVFDLGNPAAPRRVRDFSLAGVEPGATGPIPGGTGVHEAVRLGNRLYLAYGTSRDGVVQIVDREKLLEGDRDAADPFAPTASNLRYPETGRIDLPAFWGAHTAMPLLGMEIAEYAKNRDQRTRSFVMVVAEATGNQCQEPRQVTVFIDITDEAHPFPVSTFQVPESSGGFCDRGGRFGPHAPQWSMDPPFYRKLAFIAWFNAGVRVVDVRDPFQPREAAFYIPATTDRTDQRCATIDGVETCKTAIQTNNVEVDDRGLIYLVDRANTGLHIVELIGPAAEIVDR